MAYYTNEIENRLAKTAAIIQSLMRQPTEAKLNSMKRKLMMNNLQTQGNERDEMIEEYIETN